MGIIATVALQSARTGGKETRKNILQEIIAKHTNCNQTVQDKNNVEKQHSKSGGMFMEHHLRAAICDVSCTGTVRRLGYHQRQSPSFAPTHQQTASLSSGGERGNGEDYHPSVDGERG